MKRLLTNPGRIMRIVAGALGLLIVLAYTFTVKAPAPAPLMTTATDWYTSVIAGYLAVLAALACIYAITRD